MSEPKIGSAAASPPKEEAKNSYGAILRSTSIFGGLGVFTILLGIVRNKVAAIVIGPAGMGVMGIYSSIVSLVSTVVGLGLHQGGIRDVAAALGSENSGEVQRVVVALRRATLLIAVAGFIVVLTLCRPLSLIAFKDLSHAWAIAALAVCIPFSIAVTNESAVLQGLRRIRAFATASLFGGTAATFATIALLVTFGEAGIVASVIATSLLAAVAMLWQNRREVTAISDEDWAGSMRRVWKMAGMGFTMTLSAAISSAVGYASMVFISRELGEASVGQYQAAWTLSAVYVGFILNAMGTDYYPRLSAASHDYVRLRNLVNEQTMVGLILVAPGVILALVWNEYLLRIFFTAEFGPAAGILRWLILGMFLRVISWPMGFVLPALSRSKLFFASELLFNGFSLGFLWMGVKSFGITGAGIAFCTLYAFYFVAIFLITRRLVGFAFDSSTLRELVFIGSAILIAAIVALNFSGLAVMIGGTVYALAIGGVCLVKLYRLVPDFRVFRWFKRKKLA